MPYNQKTAIKNQKDFLGSQLHCGYPAIEKRAREQLDKLKKYEVEQEKFNERIRKFNAEFDKKRNVNEKTEISKVGDWSLRKNYNRKSKNSDFHPSLVFGIENKKLLNIGVNHNKKRGHHNNIPLDENPEFNNNSKAYIRTDIKADDEKYLKEYLKMKGLMPNDISKVMNVIEKSINKKR